MRTLLVVALVLGLGASSHGRPSLEDIHSRERHGFSVRELAEKMSSERSTGYGELTEDDAAVLFLRYQHEFNRTIASGAYSIAGLTPAFEAFDDNARRYASFAATGEAALCGIQLAINELADISEADWDLLASSGRRRLTMPFAQQHRRASAAIPPGSLDWRQKGYVPAEVPSLAWGRYSDAANGRGVAGVVDVSGADGTVPLLGTAAAKAACLDALYQRHSRGASPAGGFAHVARHDTRLLDALEGGERRGKLQDGAAFSTGAISYGALHSDANLDPALRPRAPAVPRFVSSPGFFLPTGERQGSDDPSGAWGGAGGGAPRSLRSEGDASGKGGGVGGKEEEEERVDAARQWLTRGGVEFVGVPFGDEVALQAALDTHGPVVVALDAGDALLQFYASGVYLPPSSERACSPRSPTHAFLLLGYRDEGADSYWILQSLWGRSWGEEGVLRLKKGSNLCGIATNAIYARVVGNARGGASQQPAAAQLS